MKTLYMMVGVSGSGKSVMSKRLSDTLKIPRHSSDEIRGELCNGDMTDQSKNGHVFKLFHERVENDLKKGSVVADATSIKIADRKAFRQIALRQGAQVIAVIMMASNEEAHKYNKLRDRNVPDWVIEKQFNAYTVPTIAEVSEIWFIRWQDDVIQIQKPNVFEIAYHIGIDQVLTEYGLQKV